MEYSYYAHWQFPVYFFFEVTPLSLGLYSTCFGLMSLCISFCNKSNERFIQWMVEKAFNFMLKKQTSSDGKKILPNIKGAVSHPRMYYFLAGC